MGRWSETYTKSRCWIKWTYHFLPIKPYQSYIKGIPRVVKGWLYRLRLHIMLSRLQLISQILCVFEAQDFKERQKLRGEERISTSLIAVSMTPPEQGCCPRKGACCYWQGHRGDSGAILTSGRFGSPLEFDLSRYSYIFGTLSFREICLSLLKRHEQT